MSTMRLFTFILSIFIVGMAETMIAGIINLMSQDLHVPGAVVGQLVTMYALALTIYGPILVKLMNRFSSRPALLWILLIFIISDGIIIVAPNFSVLVVGRTIPFAVAALTIVKVLIITAMLSAPKNRGKMIGLVYTEFSGASVFGVLIGTVTGDLVGWRYTSPFLVIVSVVIDFSMMTYLPKDQEIQRGPVSHETPSHEDHVTSKILRPVEVAEYLIIMFLVLVANSVTFVFINPLILPNGHDMSFVSSTFLVNGIAGVVGTSLGGISSGRITSKRWLMISVFVFIVTMLFTNLILPGSDLLLAGLFTWNTMQWGISPAVQSGVIQHVKGGTSQVMGWGMSSLNAGIGVGGIIGDLVMTRVSVQAIMYMSVIIGSLGLIAISTSRDNHYVKTLKSS